MAVSVRVSLTSLTPYRGVGVIVSTFTRTLYFLFLKKTLMSEGRKRLGGECPGREVFGVETIQVGSLCWGTNCSEWEMSGVGIVRDQNCPGGKCP